MANEYIHCPRCGSSDIRETDYEDESGEVDTDGRGCNKCRWEGSVQELVARGHTAMSTPRHGLPRWVFGETEMTKAPRPQDDVDFSPKYDLKPVAPGPAPNPEQSIGICIAKIANFVRDCGITGSGEGLNEFGKTHNNALAIAIGQILDPQDNVPLIEAVQAYADAISKPRLELQAKYYKTLKLLGEARERISELDKELAEEKRRSNALLNLGRGEGNSDATR